MYPIIDKRKKLKLNVKFSKIEIPTLSRSTFYSITKKIVNEPKR